MNHGVPSINIRNLGALDFLKNNPIVQFAVLYYAARIVSKGNEHIVIVICQHPARPPFTENFSVTSIGMPDHAFLTFRLRPRVMRRTSDE